MENATIRQSAFTEAELMPAESSREQLIEKIIRSQMRGPRMDYLVYNDKYNALNKLSIEDLKKELQ